MSPLMGVKIECVKNKGNPEFFSCEECCRRIEKVTCTADNYLALLFLQDLFELINTEFQDDLSSRADRTNEAVLVISLIIW